MSIKINVGGKIFETTKNTLLKINYFKYIMEDTDFNTNNVLFIDRSPHIFKHVLAYAIDEHYSYPEKYANELDFYDVAYDKNKLKCSTTKIIGKLATIENEIILLSDKIKLIGKPSCVRYNCENLPGQYNVCSNHAGKCTYYYDDEAEYCDIKTSIIINNQYICAIHKQYI